MNAERRNEDLLREASALGDEDGVKALIESGVDINHQHCVNGWTGLHWAAKRNRVSIVRLLLSKGADPSLKSAYGETALSLASNEEIRNLLSGGTDLPSEYQERSSLPITPNYLNNPPLAPKIERQDSERFENSYNLLDSETKRKHEEELVLKVRTADSEDPDFIEIEIPVKELSYENVFRICCEELEVAPRDVLKIRKLPNTIVRKDKDVLRFQHFQEIELVLKSSTVKKTPVKDPLPYTSFKEASKCINNNNNNFQTSSPLEKNSNYCKNGTILY